MQLKKTLEQYIREFSISSQSKVAVAVSGGSDSLGLALLLAEQLPKLNITLLTIDHGLRAESATEAKQVKQWAHLHQLEHHTLLWQEHKKSGNLMQNAREARYKLLHGFCRKNNISYLFLGHTLDDQIETFFINLERGSGLDGLCAMDEFKIKEDLHICRPLLNTRREEIRAYLNSINQAWIDDPSNENENFLRVKIRNLFKSEQLLFDRINLAISNLKRTKDFIKNQIANFYKQIVNSELVGIRYFNQHEYSVLDEELRLRIINQILEELSPLHKKRRLTSVKKLDQLIVNGNLKNHNLSEIGISAKRKIIYFYPLIKSDVAVELRPYQSCNFFGYQIESSQIKEGLKLGLASKAQYLVYKKNKKSFPSLVPCNMILNIPVVFELEKIVFIPHIKEAGLIDLKIYIKSYLKSLAKED